MELILNSFGTNLVKDNGMFLVQHKDGEQRIPPEKLKSILISKGSKISSDAVLLAIEHDIDVMFTDSTGNPAARVWGMKFGSVSTIRRKQLDFTFSGKAVNWIKEVVINKIDNQEALLLSIDVSVNEIVSKISKSITKLEDYKQKIQKLEGETVSDIAPTLRGWEGAASKIYFEVLGLIIPEKYKFGGRSQHPATDPFNCLLNYGYGMLYGKIESALIKAGIDPYIGVFHRDDYNRPVLVFDVIELFRIWVDYVVVALCTQNAISDEFFVIKDDGSYWLEGLGKRIVIQSVNDYLDEVINMNGLERSRATHIFLYAQNLAQKFLTC